MAASGSHHQAAFSSSKPFVEKYKAAAVLLLCVALALVPSTALGQSNQQQEQQQREQQEREQQQRDQQQREQQQREQQQRDQQQREQQEREQQQRDQQQREQQQREQQQRDQQQREQQEREQQQRDQQQREQQEREQQQRDQQQREQQQREQQQRDQQQREQQERERQKELSNTSSTASSAVSRTVQSSESNVRHATSAPKIPSQANSSVPGARTVEKDKQSGPSTSARDGKLCSNGPCKEPEPKPVTSNLPPRTCKDGPCPACSAGQSRAKDGSCVVVTTGKAVANPPAAKATAATQLCPAGQIWNGLQCVLVGAQQCLPGRIMVGALCQVDCTSGTAGAQNLIMELRNARQNKDEACRQDPGSQECQIAEGQYSISLNEYRGYVAGVPAQCGLPDPITI